MSIYLVDVDPADAASFEAAFAGREVRCVERLRQVGRSAEVVSVFIHNQVDCEFLDGHPSLRLIATRSSGTEHIDLEACRAHGVAVVTVPSYGEHTVAEHTFALILALSRRLRVVIDESAQEGRLVYGDARAFELRGKTLGVLGAGRIGRHVITIALAFGMKVLAYDQEAPAAVAHDGGFVFTSLEEVLAESHILTLHLPLNPQTHHLLSRPELARCRVGVVVINTARGALIDTEALLEALDSGQVAGAGLDVLEEEDTARQEMTKIISEQIISRLHQVRRDTGLDDQEPSRIRELQNLLRNRRLIGRPNVVFTPHVAFNSVDAVARINTVTAKNILHFLAGQPINLVSEA